MSIQHETEFGHHSKETFGTVLVLILEVNLVAPALCELSVALVTGGSMLYHPCCNAFFGYVVYRRYSLNRVDVVWECCYPVIRGTMYTASNSLCSGKRLGFCYAVVTCWRGRLHVDSDHMCRRMNEMLWQDRQPIANSQCNLPSSLKRGSSE